MSKEHKTFFGKLIAAIGGFFSHLVSGAKSAYDELPQEQKDQLEKGVNVSQLLKSGYSKGEAYIVHEVATSLKVDEQTATTITLVMLKDMGFNVTKVQDGLDQIADKIQAGITDNNYNDLWQLGSKSVAIYLSGGKLDWVSLSMGLIEWAVQHFLKSKA